jgi:hemerythrin-like domain-containing protein
VTGGSHHEHGESLGAQVFDRLGVEHERLADIARLLEDLLPRLDDPAAAEAFLTHLEFVHEFCELLHFPMEDALLEVILEVGLTPSERRVVFVNLAQHQQLYAEAVGVLGCLGRSGSSSDRERLPDVAAAYVGSLRAHLEFESRHLQPLLRRHLTGRDAVRLEGAMRDVVATLAGKPLERLATLDAASRELHPA